MKWLSWLDISPRKQMNSISNCDSERNITISVIYNSLFSGHLKLMSWIKSSEPWVFSNQNYFYIPTQWNKNRFHLPCLFCFQINAGHLVLLMSFSKYWLELIIFSWPPSVSPLPILKFTLSRAANVARDKGQRNGSGVLCNMVYHSETHLKLKSHKISSVHNSRLSCPVVLKCCTGHGSVTAVLCATLQNDCLIEK